MEPWGTSELTGYSCKDLPFRTTQGSLILRKDKIRSNTRPKILSDLTF